MNKLKDKPFVKRPVAPRPTTNAADQVDWRTANKLNTVKNQGQCGSCWAFSTTGTLEAAVAIATGKLKSFSEQQLVDCCGSKGYECEGCNGAWPEWALNYINKEGIVLETEYPYTARGGVCKSVPTAQKYLNSAKPWTMIAEADLKEWISHEPVSVCVDASNWSLYKSGVFSNCGSTNLNHAVVAIGYNVAVADKYLLIRNSWGTAWGENGHIRLKEGNNTCGVGSHALVANLS